MTMMILQCAAAAAPRISTSILPAPRRQTSAEWTSTSTLFGWILCKSLFPIGNRLEYSSPHWEVSLIEATALECGRRMVWRSLTTVTNSKGRRCDNTTRYVRIVFSGDYVGRCFVLLQFQNANGGLSNLKHFRLVKYNASNRLVYTVLYCTVASFHHVVMTRPIRQSSHHSHHRRTTNSSFVIRRWRSEGDHRWHDRKNENLQCAQNAQNANLVTDPARFISQYCCYVPVAHSSSIEKWSRAQQLRNFWEETCEVVRTRYRPKVKLVTNDQNCAQFISKTVHSFDRLCRSCVVDDISFAQIQSQIRRKRIKSDENFFGCTCFVVLNSSLISPISQCHRPVVTGVTWGWTTS
jgi:hypothetical protein